MTKCLYSECQRVADGGRGYCGGHYQQVRLGKPLTPLLARAKNKGKTCAGPECLRPAQSIGLCGMHRMQQFRGRELTVIGSLSRGPRPKYDGVSCGFAECDKQAMSLGLCNAHHQQQRRGVELHPVGWRPPVELAPCSAPDCKRTASRRGWCDLHYRRVMRTGSPERGKAVRAVDGRRVDPESGYAAIKRPGHVEAKDSGWGAEHRIVMSDHLDRALYPDENVHHRNGDRADNRLSNLELWSKSQPPGQRVVDKVEWAREILARYEPELDKLTA